MKEREGGAVSSRGKREGSRSHMTLEGGAGSEAGEGRCGHNNVLNVAKRLNGWNVLNGRRFEPLRRASRLL